MRAFHAATLLIAVVLIGENTKVLQAEECPFGCLIASNDGHFSLKVTRVLSGSRFERKVDASIYTLYDQWKHKKLWSQRWNNDRFDASKVCLSDTGTVVGWAGARVFALEPLHGQPVVEATFEDQIPENERKGYSVESEYGPDLGWYYWLGFFVRLENHEGFVIRTWWGRRIVVDLSSTRDLPRVEFSLDDIAQQEKQYVRVMLQDARRRGLPSRKLIESDSNPLHQINAVALAAGLLGLKEAIPDLLALERWDYCESEVVNTYVPHPTTEELRTLHPNKYNRRVLRTIAQLSLRRLGVKPAGFPSTTFCIGDMSWPKCRAFVAHLEGPREALVDHLVTGMKLAEITQTIGEPDFVIRGDESTAWEYDMDAEAPYTLRVTFKGGEFTIAQIERISPAKWTIDDDRMRDMMIIYSS